MQTVLEHNPKSLSRFITESYLSHVTSVARNEQHGNTTELSLALNLSQYKIFTTADAESRGTVKHILHLQHSETTCTELKNP